MTWKLLTEKKSYHTKKSLWPKHECWEVQVTITICISLEEQKCRKEIYKYDGLAEMAIKLLCPKNIRLFISTEWSHGLFLFVYQTILSTLKVIFIEVKTKKNSELSMFYSPLPYKKKLTSKVKELHFLLVSQIGFMLVFYLF